MESLEVAASDDNGENLSDLFIKIWTAYEELENTSEPTKSDKIQVCVLPASSQNVNIPSDDAQYIYHNYSLLHSPAVP